MLSASGGDGSAGHRVRGEPEPGVAAGRLHQVQRELLPRLPRVRAQHRAAQTQPAARPRLAPRPRPRPRPGPRPPLRPARAAAGEGGAAGRGRGRARVPGQLPRGLQAVQQRGPGERAPARQHPAQGRQSASSSSAPCP